MGVEGTARRRVRHRPVELPVPDLDQHDRAGVAGRQRRAVEARLPDHAVRPASRRHVQRRRTARRPVDPAGDVTRRRRHTDRRTVRRPGRADRFGRGRSHDPAGRRRAFHRCRHGAGRQGPRLRAGRRRPRPHRALDRRRELLQLRTILLRDRADLRRRGDLRRGRRAVRRRDQSPDPRQSARPRHDTRTDGHRPSRRRRAPSGRRGDRRRSATSDRFSQLSGRCAGYRLPGAAGTDRRRSHDGLDDRGDVRPCDRHHVGRRRRSGDPSDERQPVRPVRLGVVTRPGGRAPDRRGTPDRHRLHEPLRLPRPDAPVGRRQGHRPRLLTLEVGFPRPHPPQIPPLPPACMTGCAWHIPSRVPPLSPPA